MAFGHWKKYINDGYSSSQNIFGRLTSSFEIVFLTANQVFMMTFCHRKNTLTMALIRRKIYLVVQLPRTKLYFQRQNKYLWWLLASKKYINDSLSSSQNVFGHRTSSYEEVFSTEKKKKKLLTTAFTVENEC